MAERRLLHPAHCCFRILLLTKSYLDIVVVMAGLDLAIHAAQHLRTFGMWKDVDARNKSEHDEDK